MDIFSVIVDQVAEGKGKGSGMRAILQGKVDAKIEAADKTKLGAYLSALCATATKNDPVKKAEKMQAMANIALAYGKTGSVPVVTLADRSYATKQMNLLAGMKASGKLSKEVATQVKNWKTVTKMSSAVSAFLDEIITGK